MDTYAEILCSAGLEAAATTRDRRELRKLPGVLGAKGAGAMQSDVLLVLMEPGQTSARELVIEKAIDCGLQLVCDGLGCEMGITCRML